MADTDPRPDAGSDAVAHEQDVLARCIEAWHAGGDAAVAEVLAMEAGVAAVVRERLAKLQRAGLLAREEGEPEAMPEQLGEFRLLRRLGGGGMGVVFLAEQLTLGRQVAVKVLRPEQRFFPGARARFRREVEVVARLGDPGIVPIYSVGEDQGVDWFAMEYVRGASLGDAIAALHGRPVADLMGAELAAVAASRAELVVPAVLAETFAGTWVQTSCRIVARMARAVQHAHERGVVHRDLKPNNTMVTPEGRVLLLDFGLAAAEGSARITRSGAMLGTLHYMAPEQLRDGATDARTDVYALGVTLYEMLALSSPFPAASEHGLRERIVAGTCTPLREHNAEVPREVQTIVAVAMDRDPSRRYATAAALAEDLERFLQHRPITARPPGAALRLVRWSQRHRASATAAALLLVAAAATPFLVAWTRGTADAEIEAARAQARSNLGNALVAVEGILASARAPELIRTPGLDTERRRRIDEAFALLQRLHQENPEDVEALALYVRGVTMVADFRRLCGDHGTALGVLDLAAAALATMRQHGGGEPFVAVRDAELGQLRGSVLCDLGRVAEAEQVWRDVVARHAGTTVPELQLALAACQGNLGRVRQAAGDLDGAIAAITACRDLERACGDERLGRVRLLDSVRTTVNLGNALRHKGDAAAARQAFDEARQRLQQAAARTADDPELRRELARADCADATLAEPAAAVPLRERALAAMQQLSGQFPDRAMYRHEVGMIAFDFATTKLAVHDEAGAEAAARLAVATHERLAADLPDNPEHRSQLATELQLLASIRHQRGDADESRTLVQRGIALQDAVVRERPDDPHYRVVAAGLWHECGNRAWQDERWREARDAWRAAADAYDAALARGSALPREPRRLPQVLTGLVHAEEMVEDLDGAVRALQRLQAVRPLPVDQLKELGEQLHLAARADFQELLRVTQAKQATIPGK